MTAHDRCASDTMHPAAPHRHRRAVAAETERPARALRRPARELDERAAAHLAEDGDDRTGGGQLLLESCRRVSGERVATDGI